MCGETVQMEESRWDKALGVQYVVLIGALNGALGQGKHSQRHLVGWVFADV